jgi:hypothetical protein
MGNKRTPVGKAHHALPGVTITAPVLARWLGVTAKAVRELAKAGIVVRAPVAAGPPQPLTKRGGKYNSAARRNHHYDRCAGFHSD